MKETKKDSTIVEKAFFKFVTLNTPNLQSHSKLIKFNLNVLLIASLKKTIMFSKLYSKKQWTSAGIKTAQISVMRVGSKAKQKYHLGFFRVFID